MCVCVCVCCLIHQGRVLLFLNTLPWDYLVISEIPPSELAYKVIIAFIEAN